MSAEATGWVWRHSPYDGAPLLVHLAIADVVNDTHENEFWMSTQSLASKARVSRSTVVATLADMQKRGLLELLEAGQASRRPSRYRFSTDPTARPDVGLASAVAVTASANWPSEHDRRARTNPIEPKIEPKGAASAVSDLAPKTKPTWVLLGMTRDEWKLAGCPEPPSLAAVPDHQENAG